MPPGIQRYINISHTYANNNFLLFTHPFLRVSDWSISKFSETHGGLCWRWSDNLWHQRFHLSWYVKGVTKIRKLFTYRWQTILSFIKNFKNVNKLSSYEFNPVRGIHQSWFTQKLYELHNTDSSPYPYNHIYNIHSLVSDDNFRWNIEAPEGAELLGRWQNDSFCRSVRWPVSI